MKKEIKAISSFLIIFLFITLSAYADFRFQVRIVQFQPTDAPPEKIDILEFVKDSQEFYRHEMQRHGYGPKTFRVENFAGKFRVHTVNGKHPIEHYTNGTWEKVKQELPAELTRLNNIYIIVINGLQGLDNNRFPGKAFNAFGGAAGGELFLAGSNPTLDFRVLVHELGHTFGIMHNTSNPKSIMQAQLIQGQGELSDYESRWLDKSHYFNPPHPIESVPKIERVYPIIVGRETIRIRVDLSSREDLHQAMAMRHWKDVIDYAFLSGAKDTAHFQIEKNLLEGVRSIEMQVMDTKGNNHVYHIKVDLSAAVNANQKKLIPWGNIKR